MKAFFTFPWLNESTNFLCHWPMHSRSYLCRTCKIYIGPNCPASVVSPNLHTIMLSGPFIRVLQPQLFQRFRFNCTSHSSKIREVPTSIKTSILQCLRCSQTDTLSWVFCSPIWHLRYREPEKKLFRITVFIPWDRIFFCRIFWWFSLVFRQSAW